MCLLVVFIQMSDVVLFIMRKARQGGRWCGVLLLPVKLKPFHENYCGTIYLLLHYLLEFFILNLILVLFEKLLSILFGISSLTVLLLEITRICSVPKPSMTSSPFLIGTKMIGCLRVSTKVWRVPFSWGALLWIHFGSSGSTAMIIIFATLTISLSPCDVGWLSPLITSFQSNVDLREIFCKIKVSTLWT